MTYVEGFLIPVAYSDRAAYLALAEAAASVYKDHGALAVVETWGDDIPDGKQTDFRRAVAAEPGENVVFSWIVWPSRDARDTAQPRVYSDERMHGLACPFDSKRMVIGGFTTILDTEAR